MEYLVYPHIHSRLQALVSRLSLEFGVSEERGLQILEEGGAWYELGETTPQEPAVNRCEARVWNGGHGGRCKRSKTNGSDFCLAHARLKFPRLCMGCMRDHGEARTHDYMWEHNGRWNDPLPKCFLDHQKKYSGCHCNNT